MCSMLLNSVGLWLIPSLLATNSIAAGKKGARMAVSWRAPLVASGSRMSESPRGFVKQAAHSRVKRHGRQLLRAADFDLQPSSRCRARELTAKAFVSLLENVIGRGTKVDGESDAAGNHVDRVRMHVQPADRDHRMVRLPIQLPAQGLQETHAFRGAGKSIPAIVIFVEPA